MTDTTDGPASSLPFKLTLENLHQANQSLLGMFTKGGPLEGENPRVTEDDFRGMPPFFSLVVGESLDPLFKDIPKGLTPNEELRARADTLLRHAIHYQG